MARQRARLVWFQHLHKAAGTSIVRLATLNGERLYRDHANGTPLMAAGRLLDCSCFTRADYAAFLRQCRDGEVTFVATEFCTPDFDLLAADPDVCLLTAMREPLERFVSNYNFDRYHGFTAATSLDAYRNSSPRAFVRDNYYCRALCNLHEDAAPIGRGELERALARLALFDVVIDTAAPETFDNLLCLGWTETFTRDNKLETSWRAVLGARWSLRRMRTRACFSKERASADFARRFRQANAYDYELYQAASAMARSRRGSRSPGSVGSAGVAARG